MTYLQTTGLGDHPIAQRGWAWTHVYVLFEKIGYGPHLCHWCRNRLVAWKRGQNGLQVDHIDGDITNNSLDNLVPSCNNCNTRRSGRLTEALRNLPRFPCADCGHMYTTIGIVNHRNSRCCYRNQCRRS